MIFASLLSVQFSSVTQSCLTLRPCGLQHARPPCPLPTPGVYSNSCPLSRWGHLILCCPLLLPPLIFPSIRVFSNESVLRIRWTKYWRFSFSISPSNEYSGLISFRMDWLDLLAVQGTLKSLLQHHNSKASILQHSAFFIVQLSHPYMTTGKTIALTRWIFVGKVTALVFMTFYMTTGKIIALTRQTFVDKVISLLFNMLCRFVITFHPRSKHLLISWLQSPSPVILESKKAKSDTVSIVSPSICHEVIRPDAKILVFWMLSFKPAFSLSSFTFIKRLFSSSLSATRVVSSAYMRLLIIYPDNLDSSLCFIQPGISHDVLCIEVK